MVRSPQPILIGENLESMQNRLCTFNFGLVMHP